MVYASVDVRCVCKADGSPDYFISAIQDISERKAAEARILRLTHIYAALSETNQAIVRCASEDALFPQICRFAVQFGGLKMAWVGLVEPVSLCVRPVASFGEETSFLEYLLSSADAESPFGRGAVGTSIRTLQPVWIQDFLHDPITEPWHERAARFGWHSMAALPMTKNGVAIGALMLYSDEVNAFDEAIRKLLTEKAMDVSFALTSYDREAARKRAEGELRHLTHFQRAILNSARLLYRASLGMCIGHQVRLNSTTNFPKTLKTQAFTWWCRTSMT